VVFEATNEPGDPPGHVWRQRQLPVCHSSARVGLTDGGSPAAAVANVPDYFRSRTAAAGCSRVLDRTQRKSSSGLNEVHCEANG
jgi:hypothetical protein